MTLHIETNVPLAAHTTLELGGPAQYLARVTSREILREALHWARGRQLPVTILGGGSNVLAPDAGVPGLVLLICTAGSTFDIREDGSAIASIAAGERWDAQVARCVEAGLAGIECLSGIPGTVGAAPIQNIGAYGQELSERVEAVEVLDPRDLHTRWLSADDCAFSYRSSRFKHTPEHAREIVLTLRLRLRHGSPEAPRYPELARALSDLPDAGLREVRQCVLALRRAKSMLLDPEDENHRSVGSFFLNPVISAEDAERVGERALALGMIRQASELPRYPQADGRMKLSAAWLIERSGIRRGECFERVGISSRHSLALVHHGGGSTAMLLAFADRVRQRVQTTFGVELAPEPVQLGVRSTQE